MTELEADGIRVLVAGATGAVGSRRLPLPAAARQAGTARLVAQSFCGWPYERSGGAVKTEADPLDRAPPRALRPTLEAIRYLEGRVTHRKSPASCSGTAHSTAAAPASSVDDRSAAATAGAADRRRAGLVVISPHRRRGRGDRDRAGRRRDLQHCRRRAGAGPRMAAGAGRDARRQAAAAAADMADPDRGRRAHRDVDDRGAPGRTPRRNAN